MTPEPHERLKAAIEERRTELGLSLREVAEHTGIATETLRAIRNGKNEPSILTKRGLEKALQWSAGSVDRVLDGGDPLPVITGRLSAQLPTLTGEIRRVAKTPADEDPFERLDRVYAEWREEVELDEAAALREAEAVRTVLESFRDRKTG